MGKGYRYSRHYGKQDLTDQDMVVLYKVMREAILLSRPHKKPGNDREFHGQVFTNMRRLSVTCGSSAIRELLCRTLKSFDSATGQLTNRRRKEVVKMFRHLMDETATTAEDSLEALEHALRGMQSSVLTAKSVADESERVRTRLDVVSKSLEEDTAAA